MNILRRIIGKLRETHWRYRLQGSVVRVQGEMNVSNDGVVIRNSMIYVDKNSVLILHEGVRIEGIGLWVTNGGRVEIGAHSFLERSSNATKPEYIVNSGVLRVADHTKLAGQRLWIRYGGNIEVGQYTNVNPGSEIRADEKVLIGSYCQLSYNLRIWDTNTHCIYTLEERRWLTRNYFPRFGYEYERPRTAPVVIGDGTWIGERASIMKGTILGENVIIGYNTTVAGKHIPANKTVVQRIELKII
ncbi:MULTISPECIES: acyltransferase [Alistipes]|uniref:DapH/DapD/GlmU-related protein n=1 Tax=Alistipes intestinihominis TaxID=3133172 RepID=A0ABV1H0Y0_9BACT|nr:DapH/DapD/GlmU-related protein [Alistipes senegalensis]